MGGAFGAASAAPASAPVEVPAPAPVPTPQVPASQPVADADALKDALGHYVDGLPEKHVGMGDVHMAEARDLEVEKFKESHPGATPYDVNAFKVGQHYDWADEPPPPTTPLGDMSTPEARLKALNRLTQNEADAPGIDGGGAQPFDAKDGSRCGPSSLIAGALVAVGPEGLNAVIDNMKAHGLDPKGADGMMTDMLQKKIHDGKPLTYGDIQDLQLSLYNTMKNEEKAANPDDGKIGGIRDTTVRSFLSSSPELAGMYKKNGMGIGFVDTDGDGKPNHFVLEMRQGGKIDGIYDPWKRNGGQVVTQDWALEEYNQAQKEWIGPNG
jgi:hypothetical protein